MGIRELREVLFNKREEGLPKERFSCLTTTRRRRRRRRIDTFEGTI